MRKTFRTFLCGRLADFHRPLRPAIAPGRHPTDGGDQLDFVERFGDVPPVRRIRGSAEDGLVFRGREENHRGSGGSAWMRAAVSSPSIGPRRVMSIRMRSGFFSRASEDRLFPGGGDAADLESGVLEPELDFHGDDDFVLDDQDREPEGALSCVISRAGAPGKPRSG